MKKLVFGLLLVLALAFDRSNSLAYYLDAPHNEANGILCSYCHNNQVWNGTFAPQNVDDTPWNQVCNDCHGPSGTDIHEALHSDLQINGTQNWSTQCVDCHNPHFQDQYRSYANSYPAQVYLVQGLLAPGSSIIDNGNGTTTIQYLTISPPQAPWDDATTWGSKGGYSNPAAANDGSRGLLLGTMDPNIAQLYEVVSATGAFNDSGQYEGSITLKGQTTYAGNVGIQPNAQFGLIYGQLIKSRISNTNSHGHGNRTVKFFSPIADPTGPGGFVDNTSASTSPEGICQVCHDSAKNSQWTSNGDGIKHNADKNCGQCHSHAEQGFKPNAHGSAFLTDNNKCTSCHTSFLTADTAHKNGCTTCHISAPVITGNPPIINNNIVIHTAIGVYDALNNSVAGHKFDPNSNRLLDALGRSVADDANANFNRIDCLICHVDKSTAWSNHGANTHATNVVATTDASCDSCHDTVSSPFVNGSEVHAFKGCSTCHNASDGSLQGSAQPHVIGNIDSCKSCHGPDKHIPTPSHAFVYEGGQNNYIWDSKFIGVCAGCHDLMGFTELVNGHLGRVTSSYGGGMTCQSCHSYAGTKLSTTAIATTISSGVAGNAPACADCHNGQIHNAGHDSNIFIWQGNCANCHGAGGATEEVVNDIHNAECLLCHDNPAGGKGTTIPGSATNGIDGDATQAAGPNYSAASCATCHGTSTTNSIKDAHHLASTNNYAQTGQCAICHTASDHTNMVQADTNCANCHSATGNTVDPADAKVHDACLTCHTPDSSLVSASTRAPNMPQPGGSAANDGGGSCTVCHGAFFSEHKIDHSAKVAGDNACTGCHNNTAGRTSGIDISELDNKIHDACTTCHNSDGSLRPPYGRAVNMAAGNNSCTDCHGQYLANHLNINHKVTANKPACLRCHSEDVVAEHITRRAFSCATCHENNTLAVVNTINAGAAGAPVNCENCHHAVDDYINGLGKFQDGHHQTLAATSGECTTCHVVGPGMRATAKMPCLKCHGAGAMLDPQRVEKNGHINGPALTKVNDGRVCFSCHLDAGAGYITGVTPLVTPLHGQPTLPGFDYFAKYDFGPDPAYPGKDNINRLFPQMHADGHSRPTTIGVTDKKHDPVWYDFPTDPYALTPNTNNGKIYWVPTYAEGGNRGRAAGGGNLTVTIQPPAAVTAGAKWRDDGIAWEESGMTRSNLSPRKHFIEGNYVQDWAVPPAAVVNIPVDNSNVTAILTYEACPSDTTLVLTRNNGGSQISWSSELQTEEFSVSGVTPSWDIQWRLDSGGATGFTVESTGKTSAIIKKTGTTQAGTYNFTLQAVGSSCPGNETNLELIVNVADTATAAPQPQPYYGLIGDTIIDSILLSVNGTQPSVFHLAGDLYGIVYAEARYGLTPMWVKTFTVAADGTLSDFVGSFNAGDINGYSPIDVIRLSDTTIAVLNFDSSGSLSLVTFSITANGQTVTQVASTIIASAVANQVPESISLIGNNIYAISHSGKSITTVAIDPDGTIVNPAISTWADINSGLGSEIEHVFGDIYAVLTLKDAKSQVMTFSITADGNINQTAIDFFDYQGDGKSTHRGTIKKTSGSGNIYAIAHATRDSAREYGTLMTIAISNAGIITKSVLNRHLIDGLFSSNFSIQGIVDGVIAVNYGRTNGDYDVRGSYDGVIQTFSVSDQGLIAPAVIDILSVSEAQHFSMLHASGDIYLFANNVFTGVKTVKINTNPPLSLTATLSANAGTNCDEMDFVVDVVPGAHSGPYLCDFNWGDGSALDNDVQCGKSLVNTHIFAAGSTSADVTWTVKNAAGYTMHPATKTTTIEINRDLDGDGLCGANDPCPNDPDNDINGDGQCGSLNAYILNGSDGSVSVIRISDDSIIKNISVPTTGPYIAVATDGATAYLANYAAKTITVLDTQTGANNTYDNSTQGGGFDLSPNGAYLYVAEYYQNSLAVYRTSDLTKIAEISCKYPAPNSVAASPDGSRVYIAHPNSGIISVVRTLDYQEIATISVGLRPISVAVSRDSAFVYVSNSSAGSVSIIRAADNTVIDTIYLSSEVGSLAVTPNGDFLYVVHNAANLVTEINLATRQTSSITVGASPQSVSITPDGSKVYVTNYTDKTVSVIHTVDRSVNTIDLAPAGENKTPTSLGRFIPTVDPGQANPDIKVSDSIGLSDDLGLDFGAIYEGFSSTQQTVTITNEGSKDLLLGNLGSIHPLGAEFALNNDNCSGQSLVPGDFCTFSVSFIPQQTGSPANYSDSIDIPNNDPDENPTVISLVGASTVAEISVADEMLPADDHIIPFGDHVVGTTVAWQATITNSGNGGLALGKIDSAKAGTTGFTVSADTCSNQTLAPAANCTFSVSFTPLATGAAADSIEIRSNDPHAGLFTIAVSGTGIPAGPDITISGINSSKSLLDTNIDVGYFDVHSFYLDKSLFIRNDGTAPLNISAVSLATDPRSFSLISDNCTGVLPADPWPANSCEIVLRFDPTTIATEQFNANLTVTSDDPDSGLINVALTGHGYQSQHAFITNSYTFCPGGSCVCRSDDNCAPSYSMTPLTISYTPAGDLDNYVHNNISTGFGYAPWGVAARPVKTFFTVPEKGWVRVHNTITKNYITIRSVGGSNPHGIAAGSDDKYLYIANSGSNTVTVLDQNTYVILATVPVGAYPFGIDVSPDNSHVYVSNFSSNVVSVIDTATNTVQATITVGSQPAGVVVSPDGSQVYVVNHSTNTVSVISTSDNQVIATIPVGRSPYGVTVSPDGSSLYVTNMSDNTISLIQTSDNTVSATITGVPLPYGISSTVDGKYIYVASDIISVRDPDPTSGRVYIVRTSDNTILTSIPTDKGSIAMGRFISPGSYDLDNDGVSDINDNCPAIANSDQADWNNNGAGDICDDSDGDGLLDVNDNCPGIANPGQEDNSDGDGVGDVCDNCEYMVNTDQADNDGDGSGDICDNDDDNDGILDDGDFSSLAGDNLCSGGQTVNCDDNCQFTANADQADIDADGRGDICDNCQNTANSDQLNSDADGLGDVCDNCPIITNIDQADGDGDNIGDICDVCPNEMVNDSDGDGYCAGSGYMSPMLGDMDNCPTTGNADQADMDSDGVGDICDSCPDDIANDIDNDLICDGVNFATPMVAAVDNCPVVANGPNEAALVGVGNQTDSDCDGTGDACNTPQYYPPTAAVATVTSDNDVSIKWTDAMIGEDGYRVERKAESCSADTMSFTPVNTIYQHDDFSNDIDATAWVQGVRVMPPTAEVRVPPGPGPALVSDASGSAEVSWENGMVKLHTVANDMADSGYNISYLEPANFAGLYGNRDFDIQVDFSLPNGTINASQYYSYVRIDAYFPATTGKNSVYVSRQNGNYVTGIQINGVWEVGTLPTTDLSGKLRLVRKNRKISGYMWDGSAWHLLLEHSKPLDADMAPIWIGIVHHAKRDEAGGQDITAVIDNFRFNTTESAEFEIDDSGLNADSDYCYRVYPFKNDSCVNWANHAVELDFHTLATCIDSDNDGLCDSLDPCPNDVNNDADNDGVCAGAGFNAPKLGENDNCPYLANSDQADLDGNGVGDACYILAPINSTPSAQASGLELNPTLSATIFSGGSGVHMGSQWQISSAGPPNFAANIIYDSEPVGDLQAHSVAMTLNAVTTYYWRVRYADDLGYWSNYSTPTAFTTAISVNAIAHWQFEEGSGDIVADSLGPNNGTRVGASWLTAGKVGGAMAFDGINDNVYIPAITGLGELTAELWLQPSFGNDGISHTILDLSNTIYRETYESAALKEVNECTGTLSGDEGKITQSCDPDSDDYINITADNSYNGSRALRTRTTRTLSGCSYSSSNVRLPRPVSISDDLVFDAYVYADQAATGDYIYVEINDSGTTRRLVYSIGTPLSWRTTDTDTEKYFSLNIGTKNWANVNRNIKADMASKGLVWDTGDMLTGYTVEAYCGLSTGQTQDVYLDDVSIYRSASQQKNNTIKLVKSSDNNLSLIVNDNVFAVANTLTAGTWNHAAITLSGTDVSLYLNGVKAIANKPVAYNPSLIDPSLGANSTALSLFAGNIDEVVFYDKVLSDTEIYNRFAAGGLFFTTPPQAPQNTTPINQAINTSQTPTLNASAFVDIDGNTHLASRWQVRTASGVYGDSNSYDSGEISDLTSHPVNLGGTAYKWHVQYKDNTSSWSAWSAETSFCTDASCIW